MECDIGQTEFTPPGCVSLSSVTEPVLGMCSAASAVTTDLFRSCNQQGVLGRGSAAGEAAATAVRSFLERINQGLF